ncbi:hypothetical protein BDR22DRAFT_885574 [Usnea florida]
MRFNIQFLFLTFLIPFTSALQTIYLAYVASSGFNPCNDGAVIGYTPLGFANQCNQNITILGHQDIAFTGCHPTSTFPFSLPNGVSDGGTPALKCTPTSNPPGGPYGAFANCPYPAPPDANVVGPVELLEYCS